MMTANSTLLPVLAGSGGLDGLVGQLFGRAARRRGWVLGGFLLALGSHVALAAFFANQHEPAPEERVPPPVEVEFLPPAPPEPPPAEPPPPDATTKSTVANAAAAPPAAARADALHLAKSDAAPAQQTDEAVDFTNDPNAASFGGGVVAVGGTAAFGVVGARATSIGGTSPNAPALARPLGDALTPLSDLSRKPQLPGSDPCRGFFPGGATDDVGDVAVLVTIGKSGRVTNTQLLSEKPIRQGFGAAARTCLVSRQFVPALDRAGNSAATAVRVNLRFSR
jgi:hypothetical protein